MGLKVPGLTLEQRTAAGTTTASTILGEGASISTEQIATPLTAATSTASISQEYSPLSVKSSVVKNLNTLFTPFTPSPPSSHLLHLNHSAVLLLPDEIHAKVRRKVKHETKG